LYDERHRFARDLVSLAGERHEGEPLLRPIMRGGRCLPDLPDLTASRTRANDQLVQLPQSLARLEPCHYPVEIGALFLYSQFESISLQRGVCELSVPERQTISK
jgi:hypothetical protein